ncbi:hypothetical protein HID58_019118 [Brassica napus]|uniref:Uncharacterized protein n=3 Tax=Brassica TaxID=3705 RepID=A0ABQ8DBW8_BRANA|nr:uncharacterized protein LOC125575655 isoform X1 [Brassica napus]KAH0926862.1 hypothetical protein HID58_019118 [Brassica napus]VDC72115.1 unnamed protein product [Brassica rapa]
MRTPALLLLLLAFVSIIPPSSGHGEWGILTEQNFSSQIRLHPHILLFVTAPWCGESRSIKNEITQLVHTSDEYGSLKLMVVYRNSEKVLAQAIGASNEITILYYHHSVPYNYRGKLRALNILSSLRPYLASPPEELPLKHLKSPESLKDFLESSDKALILFEFCGWTSTLLSELKRNVTEDNLWHGNFSKKVETDRVLKLRGKNNQKVAVADHTKWKLMCRLQSGFGRVPWLEDFSYVNDTAALQENDRANGGSGQTCNHEQFKQFSSFLSKLIAAAKEFSLPPERQKFGLITEKSLASPFTVGESDSWTAVLQLAGCPHCSKILKAEDDIQRLLKMENPIVSELEDNRQDHESSLPANKPSVILFVDRSSGSLETRRKSMKALCTFREVAAQHKASDIINWGNDIKSQNSVSQADEESGSVSLQKTARSFKTIKLENKVSFVIMDGDKNVALDTIASGMEGSSLQELLTNLVHRRKEKKLSSIAKDVGFRLLSDDVHIKILDALPSQAEVIPGQDTSSAEGSSESSLEPREGDVQNKVGMSLKEKDKMKPPESESSPQDDKEQVSTNRSEQLVMDKAGVYKTKNVEEEIKVLLNSESKEDLVHSFTGLFFFSDANYKLLRGLTGDVKIPSAVIIDPALQQHYVLQDELAFSYSSLVDSLHGYLNGSLSPYTRSETTIHKPKEATVPPFVNLDFHEADSIPRITVNRFSHMVQAWNQSSGEKAPCPLCEDVLVLFSNSWCGFCQRMELAVREVYRSLKDCKAILQRESKNKHKSAETPTNGENLKSPLIYLMDCTLNDCSLILNSINQREVYPSVVFFPAERNKVILYEGETSVTDITEFLDRHANNSREFFRIIPTLSGKGRKHSNKLDQSSSAVNNEVKEKDVDKLVEVVVSNRDPPEREVTQDQVSPQSPPMHSVKPAVPKVKIGTILVATERLGDSPPFSNSKILILKASRESGFMGVIFNKRLRWSSFPDLDGGQTAELLKDTILSLGGPVMDPEKPLLALSREGDPSTDLELSPGVYFLDHESVARRIQELKSRDVKPSDYWFFVGYSSWSYEQLFDEIGLGVWDVDNNQLDFAWP